MIERRALPLRVRDLILEQIRSGSLEAGHQLPPEGVLSEEFGVGRSTIREAVKLLVNDGVIDVQHGRGSFVTGLATLETERPITRFESVTEMTRTLGYEVENKVIDVIDDLPTPEEAADLQIAEDEPVVRLSRLRMHDGKPLVYSENVLPRKFFQVPIPEVDWNTSIIELLDACGLVVVASSAHMRATAPPKSVATGVELGSDAWLLITETCVTSSGDLVLLARDYHRGDAFTFNVVRRRFAD
jgi:GntR family transcriptional regulator